MAVVLLIILILDTTGALSVCVVAFVAINIFYYELVKKNILIMLNCVDFFRLILSAEKEVEKGRSFVFRAPEYETESEDDDDKALVLASTGKRFTCDELYLRCLFCEPQLYSCISNHDKANIGPFSLLI